MPAWALYAVIVTVASATGFALYQLRATIKSVEEIFVDEGSALNSIFVKALFGAVAAWLVKRTFF